MSDHERGLDEHDGVIGGWGLFGDDYIGCVYLSGGYVDCVVSMY